MKKRKLGKLTALWLCWELWDWCAKTGTHKSEWPKWEINGGNYHSDVDCFACNYSEDHLNSCGSGCIVPHFRECGSCDNEKSAYYKLPRFSNNWGKHKKYARIIATSAYKEYVRLGGKKRK